jgi:hypothetical protein
VVEGLLAYYGQGGSAGQQVAETGK